MNRFYGFLFNDVAGFFERVVRTIRWIPAVWRDCDWEPSCFFELLEFKLNGMKRVMGEGSGMYDYKKAADIEYALKILRRINSDPYIDIAYMFHDKKWGEAEMRFERVDDKFSQIFFDRANVITEEDAEQQTREFLQCAEREDYLEQQDIDILFRHIARHIRGWWT